jgi:hypothetical protein
MNWPKLARTGSMPSRQRGDIGAEMRGSPELLSWSLLGWAAAALLTASHAWMLNRYAVNFPTADDFTQLLAVPGYVEHTPTFAGKVAYLFSLSVDHRILTLRAIAYLQAMLPGGLDFRALIFFGNALCVAAGLLVLWRAPSNLRGWLAPLFALLLFSPTNWLAQYWPTGAVQHFALIAYALFALFCVQRTSRVWSAAAVFLALCAALTAANGLMVFPAAAVQLWLSGRRRHAVLWFVGGLVLGLVYFIGYATPEGRPTVLEAFHRPGQLFTWYLIALGSMATGAGNGYALPIGVGAALIVVWLWLFGSSRRHPVDPMLLGWTLFLFASTATITIGRAPLGIEALGNSRYRVYSEFAVLIAVVATILRLRAVPIARMDRWFVAVLVPLALLWSWQSWDVNMAALAEYSFARRNALDHYVATGGQGMYGEFPPQDFGDFILARTRNAGQFLPAGDASPTGTLVEAIPPPIASPSRFLDAAVPFAHAGALSIHGQTRAWQPLVMLWLRGNEHAYRGTLQHERILDPLFAKGRHGFWNTWTLAGIAPGRYQVGYAQSDSASGPVFWSDDWITVQ